MKQAHRLALFALVLLVGSGCTPRFTISIGSSDSELVAKPVFEDADAVGDVATIDVRGLIADARTPGLLGAGANPVDSLVARLEKAEKDERVRAVILRISSPGGTVTGSDMMYREVRRFSEKTGKPVIASLGEIAASGGYYLALAADVIVAQPTSITGSIGVIIPTVNVSEGLNRIGIVARNVKSGPNKDLADPLSPPRDSQYAVLQGMVGEFYARFRGLVVSRRTALKPELVDELTDGRVITGARAVECGLADREGGLREAFELAKERVGIKAARLVKYVGADANPRTPYAAADGAAPRAEQGRPEINLVQIRLNDLAGPGAVSDLSGVYYLWLAGIE